MTPPFLFLRSSEADEEPTDLEGKVILIIGGAGSIGAASARQFAHLGARIAIAHRDLPEESAAANALVGSLEGEGHITLVADVAQTATLTAMRAELERRYGRLDVLVNAAGFTRRCRMASRWPDDDLIDRMFAVNRGQFVTIAPLPR